MLIVQYLAKLSRLWRTMMAMKTMMYQRHTLLSMRILLLSINNGATAVSLRDVKTTCEKYFKTGKHRCPNLYFDISWKKRNRPFQAVLNPDYNKSKARSSENVVSILLANKHFNDCEGNRLRWFLFPGSSGSVRWLFIAQTEVETFGALWSFQG